MAVVSAHKNDVMFVYLSTTALRWITWSYPDLKPRFHNHYFGSVDRRESLPWIHGTGISQDDRPLHPETMITLSDMTHTVRIMRHTC